MDNLNLHGAGRPDPHSRAPSRGPPSGRGLRPHYTPKHGSWLNPAEIEASLWSRECHGRDRVDTFEALRDRTRAWTARADRATADDHLAIYHRQGAASLPLQTAEHYVAVEALVECTEHVRRFRHPGRCVLQHRIDRSRLSASTCR